MNIKIFIPIIIIIIISIVLILFFTQKNNKEINEEINKNIEINNSINQNKVEDMDIIYIKVNNHVLNVNLEDNSSTKALLEKLKEKDIAINAHDYGRFEKVGSLGFSLPRNDTNITTEAGDLILYQGNQITLYYDTNKWTFTKLGRVTNVSAEELRNILGEGDVTLVFSLSQ